VKKFKITHDWLTWELEVEIDEAKAQPAIKEMVEFWMGWENALDENEGDYTKTFLQNLARECITIAIANNFNMRGIISAFNDGKREGWTPMDGSQGIKITGVDLYNFERSEFSIEEVQS